MMNLFARALGGIVSDRFGKTLGLKGRVRWLFLALFCEGLLLIAFSQARETVPAIAMLLLVGLFVKMSNGATYAVVPFINREALGSVAGIVGAGGNVGAVAAGFLFKGSLEWSTALLILGCAVTVASFVTFSVRFTAECEVAAQAAFAAIKGGTPVELTPTAAEAI